MPGKGGTQTEGNQQVARIVDLKSRRAEAEDSKNFEMALTIWKNFQYGRGSEPQFFPTVPEGVVVHPQEHRGTGLVPPRRAERLPEQMPV